MSKKKPEVQQPAFVDELLKNGTVVLQGKTCEDIAAMIDNIPADCRYKTGAIGFNHETGCFTLRLDINN